LNVSKPLKKTAAPGLGAQVLLDLREERARAPGRPASRAVWPGIAGRTRTR
jgi:hypothetical protein